MNQPALAASILLIVLSAGVTCGQSFSPRQPTRLDIKRAESALTALQRLESQVIVYESLGAFEDDHRLARVSIKEFERELTQTNTEVGRIVSSMEPSKTRTALINALASYRDGLFWWRKIDQRRVVHVSAVSYAERTATGADAALLSSIPYTVAIHWRQASRYLKQVKQSVDHRD